jgi:hypothetical protein
MFPLHLEYLTKSGCPAHIDSKNIALFAINIYVEKSADEIEIVENVGLTGCRLTHNFQQLYILRVITFA